MVIGSIQTTPIAAHDFCVLFEISGCEDDTPMFSSIILKY